MGDHEANDSGLPGRRRTIVVLDVAESVRIIERAGQQGARAVQELVNRTRQDILPPYGGQFIKSTGDGMLLAFDDVPEALSAALAARKLASQLNEAHDAEARIRLRAAISLSDVVLDDLDARGAGVNVAYRLNGSAEPDQILLTDEANERLHPALDIATEDLGDRYLKHLSEPVRCYRVREPPETDRGLAWAAPSEDVLRPSVAVLPFRTDGHVDGNLDVGDLIADDLINALSQLGDVRLVAHLSTRKARQRTASAVDAGRALKAEYVVAGVCHVLDRRIVLHAELSDTRRASVIEHFRITADLASLASDESPVVLELVNRIGGALLARQAQLAQRSALPSLAAHTLLLGGITLMHRLSRRDFDRARVLLEGLVERWPRLPTPSAWLARWHLFSVIQGWSADPVQSRQAAHDACRRSLDLDGTSSIALAVAGSVQIQLSQDVDRGIELYETALHHNPSDPLAWTLYGTAHAFKGEGLAATDASHQAARLSPLDPMHFLYDCHAASSELAADRPEQALLLAERSLRANAQHLSTYRVLAIAQALCLRNDAAETTVKRLLALDPSQSVARFLKQSPSAAYPIGQRFARILGDAGLPLK
ncbi:MAG: hypothetical protein LCI02_13950 [Proteobacteria bacterium]|nr:hypothetical protein [Pseudomonadota bacterium]